MAGRELSPARLEAISDGVIAVVLTIMVLELHPLRDATPGGLLGLWPHFAIYLASFWILATYWVNHRYLFSFLKRVDEPVLWTNMLCLFLLSLIPFFTATVGVNRLAAFSMAAYASALLVAGLAFAALSVAVGAQYDAAEKPTAFRAGALRIHLAAQVTNALAIPAAFIEPRLSLAMMFAVGVLYTTRLARPRA